MISLDEVAPDSREMIQAFRGGAATPLHLLDPVTARAAYLAACRANAPAPISDVVVHDTTIARVPCRVYDPPPQAAPSPSGGVLFLHGGGWVVGDLDTHDETCRSLATGTGARVIAAGYRLAPEHHFPAAHDDAIAVATAVFGDGAGLLDPAAVVVIGDSAGGNLAAWVTAEAARGRFPHQPLGQVLIYPVADLTATYPSHQRIVEGFPLTAATMRWFATTYVPDPTLHADPRVSPLRHPVTPGQPPTFIATTGLDPLADEGIAFAAALASSGTAVEHHHYPRHAHGLLTAAGRVRSGQRLRERVFAFTRDIVEAAPADDR